MPQHTQREAHVFPEEEALHLHSTSLIAVSHAAPRAAFHILYRVR